MRLVKLSEILNISMGKTPARKESKYWGKGQKWVSIRDLNKKIVTETKEEITNLAIKETGIKRVSQGTLLFSFKLTIGKMAFAGTNLYTNEAIAAFVIKNPELLDADYLYYALKSAKLVGSNQAAMGKTLNSKSLAEITIPLPNDIIEQRRIAHVLGKVEGLIAQRKQHLLQLDELLKSVFLDMFGDPVRNEKGWDTQPCEKAVLNISSGTSYSGEDRPFEDPDEIGVLKISAVTKGVFNPAEFKVVNPSQVKKALRFVKQGDFLFSRANTIELVAACCVVPNDYDQLFLPDKLWVITINRDLLDSQYLNYLLKNDRYRDVVRSLASGGHDSMLNISMKKFKTLDMPCPPLDLQNRFSDIVKKIENLKAVYQQSLSDLESLYGALSQKAFKGELDLSRVPLPDIDVSEVEQDKAFDAQTEELIVESIDTSEQNSFVSLDEYPMSNPEGRTVLLRRIFEQFVSSLNQGDDFKLEILWETARMSSLDYMDEDSKPFGQDDYELVKNWVFDLLNAGDLQQVQNVAGQDDKGGPIYGNLIELKVGVQA